MLDFEQGVGLIEVGPSFDPTSGDSRDVRNARKLCGPNLAQDVRRELKIALRNAHSNADMSCEDLECVHAAAGEWDSQERVELARKGDRLIVIAIERVLDVPMRDGADKDIAWAAAQRQSLVRKRCR